MLLRLEALQVSENWELIKRSLRDKVFTTEPEDVLTNILQACLKDQMQYWVLTKNGVPAAAGLTSVTFEPAIDRRLCNVYAMYALNEPVPLDAYRRAYETIKKFARSRGCNKVTMFTQEKKIAKLFQSLGDVELFIYGEIQV